MKTRPATFRVLAFAGALALTSGLAPGTALRQLGVETEMVVYPREPHGIEERAHQIDVQRRVLAWFDAHLGK